MANSEVIESKKLEVGSAIIIAALTGFLTLAGVMSSSLLGWISSKQSAQLTERAAKISEQQSCIARIDLQENNLRTKADLFLSALGNYVSLNGHTVPNNDVRESRLDELLKAGFAFSAYAPSKVSSTTQNMIVRLKNSLSEMDEKKASEYREAVNDTYRDWNIQFQNSLGEINAARNRCSL